MSADPQPARLPRSEEDLAEWSVYVDHLLTIGDPLGEWLALDLSLASVPSSEQMATYREASKKFVWHREALPIAWCLGHVRELQVRIAPQGRPELTAAYEEPMPATINRAIEILARPNGRLVEKLSFRWSRHDPHWEALFAAIPSTCRRFEIGMRDPTPGQIDELIGLVPPFVREIEVRTTDPFVYGATQLASFVRDRFDVVDLSRTHTERTTILALDAAARDANTIVRVGHVFDATTRLTLGGETDGAIVYATGATAIPRWRDVTMHAVHGVLPVRASLGRRTEETYGVSARDGQIYVTIGERDISRRGGAWQVHGRLMRDGATFGTDGVTCTLVTENIDRRVRELLAR